MANVVEILIKAVDQTSTTLRGVSGALEGNAAAWRTVGLAVGAVGTAIVAGIGAAVFATAAYANEIKRAAAATGIGVEALQKLRYAAEQNETSVEDLENGLKFLSKALLEAQDPTSDQAKLFSQLGIKTRGAGGEIRSTSDLLPEIADRMEQVGTKAERDAIAFGLMGRSGNAMIPMLVQGGTEIKRLGDEAQRLGGVMSSEAIEKADAFGDSLNTMKTAVRGAATAIGTAIMPALTGMVQRVTEIIGRFSVWMQQHPQLTALIVRVAAVLGGLLIVIGGVMVASAALGAIWAFITSPITIIIGLVLGLAVALNALGKQTQHIGLMFSGLSDILQGKFAEGWEKIKQGAAATWNGVSEDIKKVVGTVTGVWKQGTQVVSTAHNAMTGNIKVDIGSLKTKTKEYHNEALENALKRFDAETKIQRTSVQDQIRELERIRDRYARTQEERRAINAKIAELEDRIHEERKKQADELIRKMEQVARKMEEDHRKEMQLLFTALDRRKELGQLTIQDEIQVLEAILNAQTSASEAVRERFRLDAEEESALRHRVALLKKQLIDKDVEDTKAAAEKKKQYEKDLLEFQILSGQVTLDAKLAYIARELDELEKKRAAGTITEQDYQAAILALRNDEFKTWQQIVANMIEETKKRAEKTKGLTEEEAEANRQAAAVSLLAWLETHQDLITKFPILAKVIRAAASDIAEGNKDSANKTKGAWQTAMDGILGVAKVAFAGIIQGKFDVLEIAKGVTSVMLNLWSTFFETVVKTGGNWAKAIQLVFGSVTNAAIAGMLLLASVGYTKKKQKQAAQQQAAEEARRLAETLREFELAGFKVAERTKEWAAKMQGALTALRGTLTAALTEGFKTETLNDAFTAWENFTKKLREDVFTKVRDGLIQALIRTTIYQQALAPLFQAIQEAIEETSETGIFDPAKLQAKLGPAIALFNAMIGTMQPLFDVVMGILKNVGGSIGAFQHGGIVTRPTLALVGEAGPEAIMPLGMLGRAMVFNVTFTGPVLGTPSQARQFAQELAPYLQEEAAR